MIDANELKGDFFVETRNKEKLDYYEITDLIDNQQTILSEKTVLDEMAKGSCSMKEVNGLLVYNKELLFQDDKLEIEFERLKNERMMKNG